MQMYATHASAAILGLGNGGSSQGESGHGAGVSGVMKMYVLKKQWDTQLSLARGHILFSMHTNDASSHACESHK